MYQCSLVPSTSSPFLSTENDEKSGWDMWQSQEEIEHYFDS